MLFLLIFLLVLPFPVYAFPDTSVLETFTGSDGTTPINGSWGNSEIRAGNTGCNIRSNAAAPNNTSYNGCYWSVTSFNADSEAYATIANVGSTSFFAICTRIASPADNTTSNTTDAYCVETEDSTDTFSVIRIDNTVVTVLGSTIASGGQITVGDKIGIKTIGDQICAWWSNDGGAWTEMGCRTDATYTAGGYIGLYVNGSATVGGVDDFGGGNSVAARRRIAPLVSQ